MKSGDKFGKIVSLFVIVAMIFSAWGMASFAAVEARQTIATENEDAEEPALPVLSVTNLVADGPVIYLGQNNRLTISIANEGEAMALKATARIFDIVPRQSEELITTLNLGALRPGMEKSRFIDWTPTVLGIHYIRVEMNCEYITRNSPAEVVEGESTILSIGFPVVQEGPEEYWGPYDLISNIITASEGVRYRDGPITIIVRQGNLEIQSGATLQLGESVTLVIESTYAGEYSIDIQGNGKFLINSPSRSTTIQSSSGNPTHTYPFHNRDTVDFLGATVMYTHGPDETQPGGIVNWWTDSTCILEDCKILFPDTHGVYVNNANLQLKGDILIGSEVNPGSYPGLNGHGIYVTGASPIIEGVTVQYQKRGGIHIESSTSGSPINVVNLPEYASSQYDRRLTYGSGSSIRPIMKSGNGATYLVFQRPETGEIYFKKTLDQGASWSMEKVIASNQELGNMDFAADGNNLAFVWEDHQDYMKLYVIYSNDGGESWTEEPMEIMLGYWPSIAVSGSNIYLIYRFIQFGGPDFFMGVRLRWNGNGMLDLEETFYNPGLGMQIGGIPKVTVGVGGTIHVVIADLTMPGGNIYYWRSTDNGESWAEPSVLGTWNYHGSTNWDFPGYFSMNALGTAVNLIWNSYDTGNYEIYGLYSTDSGSNWGLSIRHTYSTGDSMFPNVGVESGTYSGYSNIVYQSDRDGSDWIYLRRVHSSGAHLGGETCMTPETSGTFMPSIAVDYSGNAYLSWCDDRVGNSEVFVKQIHFAVKNVVASQNGKLNYGYGITISNSNGGLVEGNNVIGNDYGIMLSYSDGNVLHGNTVTTNDRFTGIRTIDSYYNVLSGNTITNSADGILIAYGIFDFSGHNLIVGNDIQFNLRGVAIWSPYSSNNIVSGNTISNNYDDGILICSPLNTVSDNIISNNGHMYNSYGIEVCDRDNTIRNNVISNNYIGVCLWDDYNTIYHNNFIDNTKRQASDGRMNTWDNGYPSGGNYWSDYTGIDEHSGLNQDIPGPDGIGDTPYAIPAGTNEDRYPLLNPVP